MHIIGYVDLPSRLAPTASLLYGNNLVHLLADMGGAARFTSIRNDAVVRSALVVHDGEITWPPPRAEAPPPALAPAKPVTPAGACARQPARNSRGWDGRSSPLPARR